MTRRPPGRTLAPAWLRASPPWLLAPAVFALAFFSPVDEARSDPAIALLATQSLLDHRTLDLGPYADDPELAYDLEKDYRIRRRGGTYVYYSHGVSLLSLPAVWLANLAGYHMLDQDDENALQNLLSALCCGLLAVLIYRLCRVYAGPLASLTIAAVSVLGSSLTSTLATGLWNTGYQLLLLGLGLLHLARRQAAATRPNLAYLALLAGLAFLCRPTAGFAILAATLALPPGILPARRGLRLSLAVGLPLAAALLIALDLAGWLPHYYSPLKLTPQTPLPTGLYGILLSPSRGLLVFSAFLIPVAAVCLRHLRALAGDRIFRLVAVWAGLQLLAIATKGNWWGGHSFGPRLLTEVMLPATLATCLAWRQLQLRIPPRARGRIAAAYLACGLAAIFIHSYQGLFNHHARRWNWTPDIDRDPSLAFDWNHPQFLATGDSLERRLFEHRRRLLPTYALGQSLAYDGDGALFVDWYLPEPGWRWSRGRSAEILLRLGQLSAPGPYLLRLRAASLGRQDVGLAVNGTPIGRVELDGPVRERAFAFEHELLKPGGENSFRFDLPGAAATATDSRVMGLALHAFSLDSLAADAAGVAFDDDLFFIRGFSVAEHAWRWTDGKHAVIDVPVGDAERLGSLVLEASALERQPVGIKLNGTDLGELEVPGGFDNVVTRRLAFDSFRLRPFRMNRVELSLPRARGTAEDSRLLGLAFVRLEFLPAP